MVLAVGCELGPTDFDMYVDGGFHLPGALIRIDIDPEQLCRGRAPTCRYWATPKKPCNC